MSARPDRELEKIDVALYEISVALTHRFGRPPTEEEITKFIFGNEEERQEIWNFEISKENPIDHSCSCHVRNQGPCLTCRDLGCEGAAKEREACPPTTPLQYLRRT